MSNRLLDQLRKNDKKDLFKMAQTDICMPTGFLPLDYRNGYVIEARDDNENLIKAYDSIGISAGSYTTIVGISGVAKTTAAVQMAINIATRYDNG